MTDDLLPKGGDYSYLVRNLACAVPTDLAPDAFHLFSRREANMALACGRALFACSMFRRLFGMLDSPFRVGIVGGGHLTQRLITVVRCMIPGTLITVASPRVTASAAIKGLGVRITEDLRDLFATSTLLFVCCRPAQLPDIARYAKGALSRFTPVVSLVGGVSDERVARVLGTYVVVTAALSSDVTGLAGADATALGLLAAIRAAYNECFRSESIFRDPSDDARLPAASAASPRPGSSRSTSGPDVRPTSRQLAALRISSLADALAALMRAAGGTMDAGFIEALWRGMILVPWATHRDVHYSLSLCIRCVLEAHGVDAAPPPLADALAWSRSRPAPRRSGATKDWTRDKLPASVTGTAQAMSLLTLDLTWVPPGSDSSSSSSSSSAAAAAPRSTTSRTARSTRRALQPAVLDLATAVLIDQASSYIVPLTRAHA